MPTRLVLSSLAATAVLAFGAGSVEADDLREIQLRRLLEPTPAELAQEREGRIYIYESLTKEDIERAMEAEFNRVESMMFIRVPKTDESGEIMRDEETGDVMVEEDGC